MNILIIGKGGREHALAMACSNPQDAIYSAPGNPGLAQISQCVPISETDVDAMTAFAKEKGIDLVIIGPEAALAAGMADAMKEAGIPVFGPDKAAAQIESSKEFAKELMARHSIPTAAYAAFDNLEDALAYVRSQGAPIVIKEDGLKAGKGVTVAQSLEEAEDALRQAFQSENRVVIEECLEGFEFSLICLVHEDLVVPLEAAQDHKRAYDEDQGPNTGGMGSYSPVSAITPELVQKTMEEVMIPAAKAMKAEGMPFTGFLYGGLMLTKDGVKVIEFNARFGDPEAEVILPRLKTDLAQAVLTVMDGKTPELQWDERPCLGVVLASKGYPGKIERPGSSINIQEPLDGRLYHMGTKEDAEGLKTNGGRVLILSCFGDTLQEAYDNAYSQLDKIVCPDLFYRHDIGKKDLK
jgi:phosphoribosylamine--glycine ligase